MKKANKKNFTSILNIISEKFNNLDIKEKNIWINWLNDSLDDLLNEDFFGTEGQSDPRGDQR